MDETRTGQDSGRRERRRRAAWIRTALFAAVYLAFGVVLGWGLSRAFGPGGHIISGDEIEDLCAVNSGVTLRAWTHIVLHHTATASDNAASIDRFHRRVRGWANGLGYDFVIGNGSRSGDGEIEVGHRWRRQLDGAHCLAGDMNRKAIGICFVGNFEAGPGPTEAQVLAGIGLVRHVARRFSIPPENILGHREVPGGDTLCPGKFFPLELMRFAAQNTEGR